MAPSLLLGALALLLLLPPAFHLAAESRDGSTNWSDHQRNLVLASILGLAKAPMLRGATTSDVSHALRHELETTSQALYSARSLGPDTNTTALITPSAARPGIVRSPASLTDTSEIPYHSYFLARRAAATREGREESLGAATASRSTTITSTSQVTHSGATADGIGARSLWARMSGSQHDEVDGIGTRVNVGIGTRVNVKYFSFALASFMLLLVLCCMHPGNDDGCRPGGSRSPPMWGPHMESQFPFRQWARDILVWSILTELPPARKCAWVVLNLRGGAAELARSIPPQALINGGMINGAQVDAMTFLMHSLSERYSPLGEETRVAALAELFTFARRGRERIDDLLTRFDLTRQRANVEGGVAMSTQGITWILLRACHINEQQLMTLLQPFNGLYPATDQQYHHLVTALRRMGHVIERNPGNLASLLHPGHQAPTFFADGALAPTQAADPWHQPGGNDPWAQTFLQYRPMGSTPAASGGQEAWNSWQPTNATATTATETYFTADYESDNGTDSDTISSCGDHNYESPLPLTSSPAEVASNLFWAYQTAKAKWRSYMDRPVRKVRRFIRRKGKGIGKGKLRTKGKGGGTIHFLQNLHDPGSVFLNKGGGKGGKKGKLSSGFGKGRRGNPIGPNGSQMTCHRCGSTDHFQNDCDQTSGGCGNAHVAWTGYTMPQEPGLEDLMDGPLAGVLAEARTSHSVLMISAVPPHASDNTGAASAAATVTSASNAAPPPSPAMPTWSPTQVNPYPPNTLPAEQAPIQVHDPSITYAAQHMPYGMVQLHPGVQAVQCIQAEPRIEMPAWTQLPSFSYTQTGVINPLAPTNQVEPLFRGAQGVAAPSQLDAGQRETTMHQRDVEVSMEEWRNSGTVPASDLHLTSSLEENSHTTNFLMDFQMVQTHVEEIRQKGKSKGKGRRLGTSFSASSSASMGTDVNVHLPPALDTLHARQRAGRAPGGPLHGGHGGIDYEGDNDACSICLMNFDDFEAVIRLVCKHLFHVECFNDYVLQEAHPLCPNCRGSSQIAARFRFVATVPEQEVVMHNIATPGATSRQPSADSFASASSAAQRVLPWFPTSGPQPHGYYHAQTTLRNGRPGLLIDIGAWTNIGGRDKGREAAISAVRAGYTPSQKRMNTPLEIMGVGNGSQQCIWESRIPVAVPVDDGSSAELFDYEVPLVEGNGSGLPLILGLRSVKEKNGVIETAAGKERLTFPGPGGYTIQWSPGTIHIPLEPAASGHLMAPCAEYAKLRKGSAGVQLPKTTLHATPAETSSSSLACSANPLPQATAHVAVPLTSPALEVDARVSIARDLSPCRHTKSGQPAAAPRIYQ